MRSRLLLGLSICAILLFSACGTVKIGRLRAEPYRYQNRIVHVQGNVVKSVGALVAGVYEVQDDTGTIYVISNGGNVPPKGSRVKLDGRYMNGFNFMGKSFGSVIQERNHKFKY
jgi:hypothetical protein